MMLFRKKKRRFLYRSKNKEVPYLVIVIIISIFFSAFNIFTGFSYKIYTVFDAYLKIPIFKFFIDIIFCLLVGLLWATYRRWRIALERQKEAEDIISSISPDVLLVMDNYRNIIMCNNKVNGMFGYDVCEILNRDSDFLCNLTGLVNWNEIYNEIKKEGFYIGQAEGKKKDGQKIALEIIIGNMSARNGSVLLLRDITVRRQTEDILRQTLAELERSNNELAQFAYIASHDLQEPLRMVASYVQLLAKRYRGKLDNDADDFISYAVDGVNRMQRLINDLLEYSHVGTHGKPFEPSDCKSILAETLINLQESINESGAEIVHGPLPTLMVDASQFKLLFQNLISNAIKYRSNAPPQIHIGAVQKNGEWVFTVSDNGIGIEQQYFERIFQIFQRLHSKTEYPGTGIGLAICKKIVERHNGRIWVESESGKGTIFYFTIPNHKVNSCQVYESH